MGFRKSLNFRFELLKVGRPPLASDIIQSMTLVMLAIVLVAWSLAELFAGDEQTGTDIENINAGASHEPV